VKRFGSISPFLEQGQTERRIGRLVANHDFIKALLRYGSFDQYVLANPSAANHRDLIAAFDEWGLDAPQRARVRGVPLVDLAQVIATEAFHVFHVGGWGAFMPGLHRLRARHARNRWPITGMIFSVHGRDIFDYAVRLAHAELCAYDGIACLSRDGRDAFARLLDAGASIAGRRFAGRLEPLPLGVDDDFVDQRGDREAARRRLRVESDAVVLLVLGRITPSQKMDLAPLLKAFAQQILPRARTPIVLVIAGGASDADRRLVDELVAAYGAGAQVRIHANFMARVKPDLLAAADVLIAPTDNTQETFGLSLLEAQSAGLPVVASRFDGYKDLVVDGEDGFLIDTWWCASDPLADVIEVMDPNVAQLVQAQSVAIDMAQLSERVLTLAHDADLRARMGAAGRGKVEREFRFSAVIRRYEAWWDDLAREAAGAPPPIPGDHPYGLSPHEIFAGYPSGRLQPDDLVIATPGATPDASYRELRPLLDPALLGTMLARAAAPTPVADLVALSPAASRGWFAVMWLLKYGILRRVR
jgi:glycosyltransferase involved in cell wall biosynthesis